MPKQLAEFVREKAAAVTEKDHINSIKDRLKNVMDLYKVSRYRPAPAGVYLSDESSAVRVGRSLFSGAKSEGGAVVAAGTARSARRRRATEMAKSAISTICSRRKAASPAIRSTVDPFPIVNWVSIKNGGRTEDDGMEDKAAKFIPNQNTLLVNADFRVFTDMVARLCKEKDVGPGPAIQESSKKLCINGSSRHSWRR